METGKAKGSRLLRLGFAVVGFAMLVTAVPAPHERAEAQELIRRQTFFDRLFNTAPRRNVQPLPQRSWEERLRRSAPEARPREPVRTQPRQRNSAAEAPVRAAPAKPKVEKLDNARVILVVGDFLAGGLAEGLEAAYAESPGVRVVERSNGSSGFVRDDYYDWNGSIRPLIEEVKPSIVVVMVGSNDRQAMLVNGQSERPQTEAWLKEYARRAQGFAGEVRDSGIPLVWTGLPPFKSSAMTSDMLAFNDIYKRASEAAGATFVDIWEGFVDENGAFASTGPDMNGQQVRLRASDGINVTQAGKRKLAFYLEKPLNKLLGPAVSPEIKPLEMENLPEPAMSVQDAPADLRHTPVVSLSAPDLNPGTELLGANTLPSALLRPPTSPQPGRADNFKLESGASPTPETTATAR